MANPLVQQGTLNRLLTTLQLVQFPELNITAPYLAKQSMVLSFEGDATKVIDTLTGTVTSPEPFLHVRIRAHLLRTNFLSELYKEQLESSTLLGDGIAYTDSTSLSVFQFSNLAIMGLGEIANAGEDPSFVVNIAGYYNINASLWL